MPIIKEPIPFGDLLSKEQFSIAIIQPAQRLVSISANAIEQAINQKLELKYYGPIQQLRITFTIASRKAMPIPNQMTYQQAEARIDIQLYLSPTIFHGVDHDLNLNILATYCLICITHTIHLEIKAFNSILLLKDLSILFQSKAWSTIPNIALEEKDILYKWVCVFQGGPNFYFRKIIHPSAVAYLECSIIASLLDHNIDLIDYGRGVQKIYFTFIADDPEDKMEGALIDYNTEERYIETSLPLSYPSLVLMTKDHNHSLLALLFLTSLKFYDQVGVQDFDMIAFYRDVKALFWAEGWLELEETK